MVTAQREVDRVVGELLRGGYSDYVVALWVMGYMTAEHRAEVVGRAPAEGRVDREAICRPLAAADQERIRPGCRRLGAEAPSQLGPAAEEALPASGAGSASRTPRSGGSSPGRSSPSPPTIPGSSAGHMKLIEEDDAAIKVRGAHHPGAPGAASRLAVPRILRLYRSTRSPAAQDLRGLGPRSDRSGKPRGAVRPRRGSCELAGPDGVPWKSSPRPGHDTRGRLPEGSLRSSRPPFTSLAVIPGRRARAHTADTARPNHIRRGTPAGVPRRATSSTSSMAGAATRARTTPATRAG